MKNRIFQESRSSMVPQEPIRELASLAKFTIGEPFNSINTAKPGYSKDLPFVASVATRNRGNSKTYTNSDITALDNA
jgi:hypothetical protein